MSNDAARASGGATYRMLRELGSRAQHSHAAIREASELLVVQRFVRGAPTGSSSADLTIDDATPLDAEAMALLLRDARCLAKNWHLNIARVRHVDLTSKPRSLLTIASELLDGATLEDLIEAAQPERTNARDPLLPLPVLVRVLLDVLGGLHALHGLRDGMNAPLGAIHGELCPANVVVGKDGVARIVNVLRPRPVRVGVRSEAVAHAAPEALDGRGTDDPRCDVYAVGVMLWEGLAGRRLYDEREPSQLLARQREGELVRPSIDSSSPFARLADVAMRALSFEPALRYRGVTDMAADLRKIAGTKLATGATVAARVSDLASDRIRMRRALLEPATSGTRRRASERSIAAVEESFDTARQSALAAEEIAPRRASMQRIAPTLEQEIPVALLAESRRTAELEDEVDIDMGATEPASAELLIAAALASTAAQMRAVAFERQESAAALPATETPGDFVIPVDVSDTWNQLAPAPRPPRHRMAGVAAIAALLLLAMGAFLAVRARTSTAQTRASSAAPFPAMAVSPTVAMPPDPNATEVASAIASASASAAPTSTSVRPAPRMAGPSAPPPPTKPKKSIYEPDGL